MRQKSSTRSAAFEGKEEEHFGARRKGLWKLGASNHYGAITQNRAIGARRGGKKKNRGKIATLAYAL